MGMEAPHTTVSLRARLGLTQAELAEKATAILRETTGDKHAKVSVSTVIRWERARNVGTDHLRAICTALGVTVDVGLAASDAARALRDSSRAKPRRKSKGAA